MAPPGEPGDTVALLVMVPPAAFTCATMLTAGMPAPTGCGPGRVQVTTPPAWSQVQPGPAAETNEVLGGKVSTSSRLPALLGPALLTVSV